jgi:ABC-type multidrug transport system fused ATPase/permease subunit
VNGPAAPTQPPRPAGTPGPRPAARILPVAAGREVREHARRLILGRRRELAATVGLYAAATIAGLIPARLLGEIVSGVQQGTTAGTVDRLAVLIAVSLLAQSGLVRHGALVGARLGEALLAQLREEFVGRVLALPLSAVEDAGSGDLLTRASRDVGALSTVARYAVPATLTAVLSIVLTTGAIILDSPLLVLPCLIVVPPVWLAGRWYLRRATAGYLRENAAWAEMTESLAETVDGARTVEALRLGASRRARADADAAGSYAAERYTLRLRSVFLPSAESAYVLPAFGTLLFGGYAYLRGWCTLGQLTAAALYARALVTPMAELIDWLDELQVGGAALARLLGVAAVPADRQPSGQEPASDELAVAGVWHSYVPGHDVLRDISLQVRPGERVAIVGPSGAGKSTLGRLLAGIMAPASGRVTVGGADLAGLPLEELRGQVALVTQEHHIFLGTLRENVTLGLPTATGAEVTAALAAVEALDWAQALPGGLEARVGPGGEILTAPQAQQIALARLVLADPHTLILDEATSLLDPRSARRLERALAAVMDGRTVIAIAHRLHTAHDADRVVVMADGRISELGSHEELIEAGGEYAALWDSWHGTAAAAPAAGPAAVNPLR